MAKWKQTKGSNSDDGSKSGRGGKVKMNCPNGCVSGIIYEEKAGGVQETMCRVCDGKGWLMGPPA